MSNELEELKLYYEDLALKYKDNEHHYKKYTYKAKGIAEALNLLQKTPSPQKSEEEIKSDAIKVYQQMTENYSKEWIIECIKKGLKEYATQPKQEKGQLNESDLHKIYNVIKELSYGEFCNYMRTYFINQEKGEDSVYLQKCNRVEVIDKTGRAYTNYKSKNVYYQLQDDERTLKVFID